MGHCDSELLFNLRFRQYTPSLKLGTHMFEFLEKKSFRCSGLQLGRRTKLQNLSSAVRDWCIFELWGVLQQWWERSFPGAWLQYPTLNEKSMLYREWSRKFGRSSGRCEAPAAFYVALFISSAIKISLLYMLWNIIFQLLSLNVMKIAGYSLAPSDWSSVVVHEHFKLELPSGTTLFHFVLTILNAELRWSRLRRKAANAYREQSSRNVQKYWSESRHEISSLPIRQD